MIFNQKAWSVSEAIKQRVQLESFAEWGKSSERGFTPRHEAYTKPQKHINWLILFKTAVMQFRP